jgi:hypothetical protein
MNDLKVVVRLRLATQVLQADHTAKECLGQRLHRQVCCTAVSVAASRVVRVQSIASQVWLYYRFLGEDM